MSQSDDNPTAELLNRAGRGDDSARQQLLKLHRTRLRQMVAVRLDRRLAARVDPSDVVQEVLAEAWQKMSDYLRQQPLPFYPWLRQLAWERLVTLHRRHVRAQSRTVKREEPLDLNLGDESAVLLARRLIAGRSTPSAKLLREELRSRIKAALAQLAPNDREVLVMRHLEELRVAEIAAVLGISEGAVKTRHLRALQRLRAFLDDDLAEYLR